MDPNEERMFKEHFQDMPLDEVKTLIIEQITAAKSWDKFSKAVFAGFKICSVSTTYQTEKSKS
jgi:hypothetical protein